MEYAKETFKEVCRGCYSWCIRSSPIEPCEDVLDLLGSLHMTRRHQLMMYTVFQELRQGEVEEVVQTATEIERSSVAELVFTRRRWVEHILECILDLGGCEEEEPISWDTFLYILLQFCSQSKVELCQTLFLVIQANVKSLHMNYLSMQNLIDFYQQFTKCPVTSFATRGIDFSRLPLRRYYVEDFCELVQRFTNLLNPIIHLQRSLQEFLPSVHFWDNHHRTEVICRKITSDFFKMDKTRCYLWGEPPFRESCEMLAPEALGFVAANDAQWKMRTFDLHERTGCLNDQGATSKDGKLVAPPGFQFRPLRQFSIWGEQPSPEETERAMLAGGDDVYLDAHGHITMAFDAFGGKPSDQPSAGGAPPQGETKKQKKKREAAMKAATIGKETGQDQYFDPTELCHKAACLDEEFNPPPTDLPPKWMQNCAIAPAPRRLGPDPPLSDEDPRQGSKQFGTFTSGWGTTTSFDTGITPPAPPPPPSQKGTGKGNSSTTGNGKGRSQVSFSTV